MISLLYFTVIFAIAYILKGGQGDDIFRNWHDVKNKNAVLSFALSDKTASTILVFIALTVYSIVMQVNIGIMPHFILSNIVICLAWMASISRDVMFDKALVGDIKGAIKDGLLRGGFAGLCMFIATRAELYLYVPALSYGLIAWAGFKYRPFKWKLDAWGWVEVFIGAVCFGVPLGVHVYG